MSRFFFLDDLSRRVKVVPLGFSLLRDSFAGDFDMVLVLCDDDRR